MPFAYFSIVPYVLAGLLLCGCGGGPSRVAAPDIDPDVIADAAFEHYDGNDDDLLTEEELAECPSLQKSLLSKGLYGQGLFRIDADNDARLSKLEMTDRLKSMLGSQVGRATVSCTVLFQGAPLPNAEVRFVPEPFMGGAIKPAAGTTDERGAAFLSTDDPEGGMQYGFYRVEISRKSPSGEEMIPERYNKETELGQEVSNEAPEIRDGIIFNLKRS